MRTCKLFFAIWPVCVFPVQGQTHLLEGQTDAFKINFDNPTGSKEQASMYIDSRSTDLYEYNEVITENVNNGSRYKFCSLSAYGDIYNNAPAYLIRDTRPYNGYTVDFPLYMDLKDTGTYTMKFITLIGNKAAVLVRLIDKNYPDKFILFDDGTIEGSPAGQKEGRYSFEIAAGETGITADRFIVRAYAACLFKKETDGDWNNADNWHGGIIPGSGDAKTNNCAIIPEGSIVRIPEGSSYQIGSLFNSGEVIIEEGASLEVSYDARLVSVKDLY